MLNVAWSCEVSGKWGERGRGGNRVPPSCTVHKAAMQLTSLQRTLAPLKFGKL